MLMELWSVTCSVFTGRPASPAAASSDRRCAQVPRLKPSRSELHAVIVLRWKTSTRPSSHGSGKVLIMSRTWGDRSRKDGSARGQTSRITCVAAWCPPSRLSKRPADSLAASRGPCRSAAQKSRAASYSADNVGEASPPLQLAASKTRLPRSPPPSRSAIAKDHSCHRECGRRLPRELLEQNASGHN